MYWNTREPYIKQRNLLEQKKNDLHYYFFHILFYLLK